MSRRVDDVDLALLVWREAPRMLGRFHAAVRADVGADWGGTAVLVENAAPEGTSAAARRELRAYRHAVVLRSPRNLGFGRAMDLALAESRAPYVALLNSDGRPEPGMLATLAAALDADPGALWAAPAVHGPGEGNEPPGPPYEEEDLAGMALLVRRAAFLALGGFDPLYVHYSEDHDASARARAAGWRLLRVPDAVFHHGKGGRSARGTFVREGLHAATDQTLKLHRVATRRAAWGQLARRRPRAIADHVRDRDWPGAGAIALASLGLPLSAVLAEGRRRRAWSGARLDAWLARARPRVQRVRP